MVVEISNTLYFLTSPGVQAPFEDSALCKKTFTSTGFCLSILPGLEGEATKGLWVSLGNGSSYALVGYAPSLKT